jgi:hypothetical protein
VYLPAGSLDAGKIEARIAWGFLKDVLENPATMQATSSMDPSKPNGGLVKPKVRESFTLAVPWTAAQVVSLQASLLKYGFTLGSYRHVEWQSLNHIGNSFCAYYQYE